MLPDLDRLQDLIVAAAEAELLPRFAEHERAFKADGSVITAADTAMQARLRRELAATWPAYGFLGEEMAEAEQHAALGAPGAGLWVLDPLDGTSNFAAGLPFFSVSLALVRDGAPQLGIVYDPVRRECFTARRGAGARLNGVELNAVVSSGAERAGPRGALSLRETLAIVDFKRLTPELARRLAAAPPYASQRSLGSVALDWCWLAAGRAHVYLHGRQKLWDYAAGSLILDEVGGHACTLEGEPVFRAAIAPRSAVAALDADLFAAWRDWLGIRAGAEGSA